MSTDPQDQGSPDKTEDTEPTSGDQVMQRAEVMVDRLGERIGGVAVATSQRLRKLAARAREEGEDMWAEAQQLRKGGNEGSGKSES